MSISGTQELVITGLKLKQDGELGLIKGLYALCRCVRSARSRGAAQHAHRV